MNEASASPRSPILRRWKLWLGLLISAVALGLGAGVVVALSIDFAEVESISEYALGVVTRLEDREGKSYREYFRENRAMLEEGEVPDTLRNALLAAEDRSFYEHPGFDPIGVVRAALRNLMNERPEGASTITMQLVGTVYLDRSQRTWRRKISETLRAVDLEKQLSKEQILTLYCNLIPLGHGNYGFQAAARYYFDKTVEELSVAEAATLVAIVPRPSDWSPIRRPDFMLKRRNLVLASMHNAGYLTDEELATERSKVLGIRRPETTERVGSYFAEEVRKYLYRTYGETALYERGLQVRTTLDRRIQKAAETAVRDGLVAIDRVGGWRGALQKLTPDEMLEARLRGWERPPSPGAWVQGVVIDASPQGATVQIGDRRYQLDRDGIEWTGRRSPSSLLSSGDVAWFRYRAAENTASAGTQEPDSDDPVEAMVPVSDFVDLVQEPELEAAVVVLENETGAIRALVGGWDFARNEFNRATQAKRQPGSAFKPFVFGAGYEVGYTPADTLFDAPVVFDAPGSPPYSPRNFYRTQYEGILTLRRAMEKSINVTSVKLLDLVGVEAVIDFAQRCSIRSPLPRVHSLALGSAEVTPLEIAAAYAAFANQGVAVEPYFIDSVSTPDGRVLESRQLRAAQAMEPEIAYLVLHTLRGVVQRGTAVSARRIPVPLAGKTGTTDDYTDAWFAGLTPQYSITVWVGHDVKRSIGRDMTGAEAALPIWSQLVSAGVEEGWIEGDRDFTAPPGISFRSIEPVSGLLANSYAPSTLDESFVVGTEPVQEYDPRWQEILALPWFQQRPFYGKAKEGEVMPEDEADWEAIKEGWTES